MIQGKVVREGGEPANGFFSFSTSTVDDGFGWALFHANTSALGEFSVPAFPGEWQVTASAGGTELGPSFQFQVPGPHATNLILVARVATQSISGLVLDVASNAMASASIQATLWTNGARYVRGMETDGDGNFQTKLFPGIWRIDIWPPHGLGWSASLVVSAETNSSVVWAQPVVPAAAPGAEYSWRGRVIDEMGNGLPAKITAGDRFITNSDTAGEFTLAVPGYGRVIKVNAGTNLISPSLLASGRPDETTIAATLIARQRTAGIHLLVRDAQGLGRVFKIVM